MRRLNLTLLLVLLGLPQLGAGCKNITIDSPAADAVFEAAPEFKVSYSGIDVNALTLQLNGNDVKGLFTVSASGATAAGSKLLGLLREGDNRFAAREGTSGREITFAYDTTGPSVRITSVKTGNPYEIQGRLVDRAGVQSLAINGQSVALQSDRFTAMVPEMPFLEFTAKDGMNHSSKTVYARPGTALASTSVARLNKSGLAFLVAELNAYIKTLDYNAIIKALNPLFDEGSWAASARVDATSVTLGTPTLSLQVSSAAQRAFEVGVQIPNMVVNVHASGTIIGIGWSANGQVWASLAVFGGRTTVSIADSKLAVSIGNISSVLNGFGFDIDGFPDVLEELFFDIVKPLIEDAIASAMATRIPPYIEDFLKDIPSEFEFLVGTARFKFAALPASLKTFLEGLTVHLGGWLETLTTAPGVPLALGSRYVSATAPDLDVKTPGGIAYDAGAAISTNLVHQALLSAYRAGLLHLTLDGNRLGGINSEALADLAPELSDEAAADDLRFKIVPYSPPFATIRGTDTALANLSMDEFDFRLEMFRNNEWKLVFGARIDMEVPFDVGVTPENKLHIGFEEVPQVKVYSVDDGGLIVIDPAFVQATLDRLLPKALPYLAGIIEEIPIPSYEGYGVLVKALWPAGTEKAYLGLAGNLIKSTLTEAAEAPDTFLAVDAPNYHSEGFFVELYPPGRLPGGEMSVALGGRDPEGLGLEYSYRLDGGHWSVWKQRSEIRLHALLSGTHTLEIRSRTGLLKEDPSPAKLVFATGLGLAAQGFENVPAP